MVSAFLAVIVNEKGEVLLQRRHDPGHEADNKWELPGGGLNYGETPEQAVIREVKEETGYDIEVIKLLPKIYTNTWPDAQVLLISYHCRIIGGDYAKLDSEVSEGKFIDPEKMDYSDALPFIKEIIELLKVK